MTTGAEATGRFRSPLAETKEKLEQTDWSVTHVRCDCPRSPVPAAAGHDHRAEASETVAMTPLDESEIAEVTMGASKSTKRKRMTEPR
jgi:hypothetical protein